METMFVTFMVAVVGNLLWIGSELHEIKKSLKVNESNRNGNTNKPPKKSEHL